MMRPPRRAANLSAASALLALSCVDASTPPTAPVTAELAAPDATGAAAAVGAVTRFVPTPISGLGGTSTIVRGVNAAGVVVGVAATSTGEFHAFAWTRDGGARDLGTLPGDAFSEARAVNVHGEIVGVSGAAFGSELSYRAVRWSPDGQISALPMGEGIASEASDVNDGGWWRGASVTRAYRSCATRSSRRSGLRTARFGRCCRRNPTGWARASPSTTSA